MRNKSMQTFLRVLDFSAYVFLALFAVIFVLIGLAESFLLIVEGDIMNIIGMMGGFAFAWICWSARKRI